MPFDLQPTLRGELLELRPLRPADEPALFAVASDPLIWEQHPNHDRYQPEVFAAFFQGALTSAGAFLVVDARDGRVLGSSRFHEYDEGRSEVEIGWTFLARSHWGGAANRELKQLMLRHAFRFVETVTFIVGAQNLRSQRALEKVGATRTEARLDQAGRAIIVFRMTALAFAQLERGTDPHAKLMAARGKELAVALSMPRWRECWRTAGREGARGTWSAPPGGSRSGRP